MVSRIGVFICDCKGLISDHIDTAALAADAAAMEDVVFVDRVDTLCGEKDLGAAIKKLKDERCDRLLFAGCSPRSSLKFPEERIASVMQTLGLCPELSEVANIREQCAWQHTQKDTASQKAGDLVRMAHARLQTDEPAPAPTSIARRALVIGGGPAGLQAAKDLDSAGVDVTLAERNPWLGGHLCQLNRVFQCEGWPSVCDSSCVGPVQAKGAILSDNIQTLTRTRVASVEKPNGSFRVTLDSDPEFVDPDLCISCDKCAEVCPEQTYRRFDAGITKRKAIDKEFERALPDLYTIDVAACTMCGDCVPVCPTGAIDLDAKPRSITQEFGAVFLATGSDEIDLSGYSRFASTHPNVVTSLEFERLMDMGLKRPSDGEEPEQIVFVQCAGSRSEPGGDTEGVEYCSKTCCAVTTKQVDRVMTAYPMIEPTVVYYRDMRTYERALESMYQHLRISGVDFVNGEVGGIESGDGGGLTVSVDPFCEGDDAGAEPVRLDADLVVLAAAQAPASGSNELYEMFGVQCDRYGYPIENQPRLFRPTESLVNRVFVIGSSGGSKVVQQASEQGSAAAMRALPALLSGKAQAPRYSSRIDPERCTSCRTCETVCPHGAIRMTAGGAVSDPAFCQACGFCAAACPTHAAELNNFTDRQILAQAEVAFSNLPPGEPRILALLCYWCSYSAADVAGVQRVDVPVNYRAIRIRCSSSVNTGLVMQMYKMGVDGIIVAGCPAKSCHHLWGNFLADKRIELARSLLSQLGLDPARLRFEYIGAPMQAKLVETITKMDKSLRGLGANPVAATASRGEM